MLLKLSLPKGKVVWALAHPVSREYIHGESGIGYQECQLIVTEQDQPVEVKLEDYPKWAQSMILTSVKLGDLTNSGDPITKTKPKETVEVKDNVATEVTKPKKKAKKKPKVVLKKDE